MAAVSPALLHRGVLPQVRGIAVVPAHVALVDRLDVVADGPVIAAGVPRVLQRRRHLDRLRDLGAGQALVEHPQRLVVEVCVQVALLAQEPGQPLAPPGRPVVRREHDVGSAAEAVHGLREVARPDPRIPYQCAPDREDVVQDVGRVLGHAQRSAIGEEDVHLRRGLGARRELELHPDAIDRPLIAGRRDRVGWGDQRDGSGRRCLAKARAHLGGRSALEGRAVHIAGAPCHGGPGVHVLRDRVLHEPVRRDDRAPPVGDLLGSRQAAHAAEVVGVAVGVDHADDGSIAAVLPVEGKCRRCGLDGDQGVDHQDARVALDEADVRQVQAADLVDAGHDFEQPVHRTQPRLPPEAGMDGRRRLSLEEAIALAVPHDAAVRGAHDARVETADEATPCVLEVLVVVERQRGESFLVGAPDGLVDGGGQGGLLDDGTVHRGLSVCRRADVTSRDRQLELRHEVRRAVHEIAPRDP